MDNLKPLEIGNSGIAVNKMQGYLNIFESKGIIRTKLILDGMYGVKTSNAVKEFQTNKNLKVDGKIGNITWNSIVNLIRDLNVITNIPTISPTFYLTQGNQGIDVFKMQEYLNEIALINKCLRPVPVDGNYGQRTTTCVQQFQYLYDQNIDGNIGKATWDGIVNERNKATAQ